MSKQILLWDPRFPGRAPLSLTVNDDIASAAVRSGVAAAADPDEAGGLAAGAPLSAGDPVIVSLQHGRGAQLVRPVVLPTAVALVAVALGLAAMSPALGALLVSSWALAAGGWSDAGVWRDDQPWKDS